jgi:hypothetical protein
MLVGRSPNADSALLSSLVVVMVPTVASELLGAVGVAPGVTVEGMGEELLALVGHRVVRVSGPAAVVLAAVRDRAVGAGAGPVSGDGDRVRAGELSAAVDALVDLGVLERSVPPVDTGTPEGTGGAVPLSVSRRRALGVAATAALGVTVLVLPQAAAASSGDVALVSGDSGAPLAVPTGVSFSAVGEEEFTVEWTVGVVA